MHAAPGIGGELAGQALGRGVGAVGGRKGVIDVKVTKRRQRFDEVRVVLFLAGVEAGVFDEQHVTRPHGLDGLGRDIEPVRREAHRLAEVVGQVGHQEAQRIGLVRPALGPTEMRQQDHLAALFDDGLDGRHDALDARRVTDATILDRHVEVDAHQNALARHGGILNGPEIAHGWVASTG